MMRWRANLSTKILTGTAVTVIATILMAGFYLVGLQRSSLEMAFDRQSRTIAQTIAVFSIEGLLTMDYPVLEHALGVAGRADDTIEYIEIMHRGVTAATYGRPDAKGRAFSEEIRSHDGSNGKLGDVYIVFSTREHDLFIDDSLNKIAWATLLVFSAFGIALVWLLRRTVIRPIQSLTQVTDKAIAEELPALLAQQSAWEGDDEIQTLGARFRALLQGLRQREAARQAAESALREHKKNLERTVEQRTHALRLAQQEANRLNQAKSVFLAAASHDLRQPIQAISLFQSALESSPLTEEQQQLSRNIGVAVASLNDILGTLLDISKLDSGAIKAVPRCLPVESLIERIDQMFGELARQRGLRFKLWFPMDGLALQTDPGLLFVLLRNLLDNALKYTRQGGVLLSVRRRGGRALIQVWDTGIGISASDQQAIFDEYVQVANPERDKNKGLGLGLSIVRRIASLIGTDVHCRSVPGRGSVFELSIPLCPPDALSGGAACPLPAVTATMATGPRKVVLVEDDALVAVALSRALEGAGMVVTRFISGDAALASPAVDVADYLISDLWLPGEVGGVELVSRLLQRPRRPMRVLMITGDPMATLPLSLQQQGVSLLLKPVELATLLQALGVARIRSVV